MRRVINWLTRQFKSKDGSDTYLSKMMGMLAATQSEELSCDDVFKLLDEFAESVLAGRAATGLMAMIEQHLQVCPDCRQEYETLMAMIKTA